MAGNSRDTFPQEPTAAFEISQSSENPRSICAVARQNNKQENKHNTSGSLTDLTKFMAGRGRGALLAGDKRNLASVFGVTFAYFIIIYSNLPYFTVIIRDSK